ncbi:restriction endonuclease subunit S [Mycoplasmopsis pulmonis]|uniref:restriction endonuclease subunit S n=1 Tax=Mycoplasmopsis pulmonis TaxID=2107 RepID=UPI002ACE3889|nr:restriction endonuclease subunit S [Mycoplasmopsis pulmonis]MDZ7293056.1 restriction endonuclease subunit S [Mycoplasmopsis pulmonis]
MAIYKLGEIAKILSGKTPSTAKKELWKKEIPFFGPGDLDNMVPKRFITFNEKMIKRSGTILFSSAATIGKVGILDNLSWFNQQITSIEANNNYVMDKFLFFLLKKISSKIKFENSSGTIFPTIKKKYFENFTLEIPNLKTQSAILNIIEPKEDLFLRYKNLVRIDNEENTKKDLRILINIFEPLEVLLENVRNVKNKLNKFQNSLFELLKNVLNNIKIDFEITTGKWNNDVIIQNGKYNFYSCSKDVKKSNKNSYNGKYIILSGNGTFYCWWYEGIFDLYQRNYAIVPKKMFFTTFWSIENKLDVIRKSSQSGSVIKYIKLNDIKVIEVLNADMENELELIYKLINMSSFLKEKISILIKKISNLLVS